MILTTVIGTFNNKNNYTIITSFIVNIPLAFKCVDPSILYKVADMLDMEKPDHIALAAAMPTYIYHMPHLTLMAPALCQPKMINIVVLPPEDYT